jgi:hypothetical protein
MARLDKLGDERGAVYVEFLIAFFPLFLLFLALCQLALVAAAEAVVRHAAYAAVRSAIVVLEDAPSKFGGAARGDLSSGNASRGKGIYDVITMLGITKSTVTAQPSSLNQFLPQQGARMVPIRTAAYLPLVPLAPNQSSTRAQGDSVANSLASTSDQRLGFALEYTRAAAWVSLQDSGNGSLFAAEPIGAKSPVTARVFYLFHCTVPVVRALMCRSLSHYNLMGIFQGLVPLVGSDARFKGLTATATLPNQGADYYARDK